MMRRSTFLIVIAVCFVGVEAQCAGPLVFEKQKISDLPYEAACALDIDKDGDLDIVSGEYWYEGPEFETQHKMCTLLNVKDYYDDFGEYPMDVNGDGYADVVAGGWHGQTMSWRENPKGKTTEWTVHEIAKVGNIERPCFWDVDGDGHVEAVPNRPKGALEVFQLVRDANGKGTGVFKKHVISEEFQGHGLGFGDVNGDGRNDFILAKGWFEAPAKPFESTWTWHPAFDLGHASVPMLVHDVNGDGKNDIIVGMAHDYGIAWWEQGVDGTWTKHDIDTKNSQYHDMALADLDNDGKPELVTGKRYYAHSGKDPGAEDPLGLYYYTMRKGKVLQNVVDRGAPGEASGAGIFMWIVDIDQNGWQDIIAPGKEGLYLFKNQGAKKTQNKQQ
jgi:hypothetical protein